jgi:hypothetical protein
LAIFFGFTFFFPTVAVAGVLAEFIATFHTIFIMQLCVAPKNWAL